MRFLSETRGQAILASPNMESLSDEPDAIWIHGFTLLVCWLAVLAIGVIDKFDGSELTSYVFYCLPIFVAGARVGTSAGLLVAITAGFAWGIANMSDVRFSTAFSFEWAVSARAMTFLFMVFCGQMLRAQGRYMIQSLSDRARADEIERHLVRIVGAERCRASQELREILIPAIKNLGKMTDQIDVASGDRAIATANFQNQLSSGCDHFVALICDVADGLSLARIDDETFVAMMKRLSQNWSRSLGLEIRIRGDDMLQTLSPIQTEHLALIARAAVLRADENRARTVMISIVAEGGKLQLRVEDDGDSYQASLLAPSWAITEMHANQIQGVMEVHSVLPHGCLVICTIDKCEGGRVKGGGVLAAGSSRFSSRT